MEPIYLLLTGASLQFGVNYLHPTDFPIIPTIAMIAVYTLWVTMKGKGPLNSSASLLQKIYPGRWTAQMLDSKGNHQDVVMFVIGVSSQHPEGRTAPGFQEAAGYFQKIWEDADLNFKNKGFLGHTTPLAGTQPETTNTMVTLSYWRDVESLHAFAHSPVHRQGWDWWNRNSRRWPHLGVMHEVYAAPGNSWENIYINFPAFGMGAIEINEGEEGEEGEKTGILRAAKGKSGGTMLGRMGRLEVE